MTNVSSEVNELVRHRLPSLNHVEVLIHLHDADEALPLPEIERLTHLASQTAANVVMDLMNAGLVAHDSASNTFRYFARRSEDRDVVDSLAILYHQFPMALARVVYAQPPHPVKDFADAFRLRDKGRRD